MSPLGVRRDKAALSSGCKWANGLPRICGRAPITSTLPSPSTCPPATGDTPAGLRALHYAERAFDGVTAGNTPVWLTFFNSEAHAARLLGRAFMRLRRPREATTALHDALNLLPDDFVRERAGTLIDMAYVCVQRRDIEQACRTALDAEALTRSTASERNLRRLRELLVELMPWTNLECVRDLYRKLLLGYY